MKKAVLFDFHNTLATCDGWLELEIKTLPALVLMRLAALGRIEGLQPGTVERATALFQELRQGVRESGVELSAVEGAGRVLSQLGFDLPHPEIEEVVAEIEHEYLPRVAMTEGADEVLEHLRGRGYRLGVVSSAGYPPFVELSLEALGLRAFFSEVVTSAGEGLYKSDPEIFRRAVRRLGASPEEGVHVGDHAKFDVQAARAAGLSAIWFAAQARRTADLHAIPWDEVARDGAEADAVITRLAELPAALERL